MDFFVVDRLLEELPVTALGVARDDQLGPVLLGLGEDTDSDAEGVVVVGCCGA